MQNSEKKRSPLASFLTLLSSLSPHSTVVVTLRSIIFAIPEYIYALQIHARRNATPPELFQDYRFLASSYYDL